MATALLDPVISYMQCVPRVCDRLFPELLARSPCGRLRAMSTSGLRQDGMMDKSEKTVKTGTY
jgi:hypothetical protein